MFDNIDKKNNQIYQIPKIKSEFSFTISNCVMTISRKGRLPKINFTFKNSMIKVTVHTNDVL